MKDKTQSMARIMKDATGVALTTAITGCKRARRREMREVSAARSAPPTAASKKPARILRREFAVTR